MRTGSIDVVVRDTTNHPQCPHGPTLLFEEYVSNCGRKLFFACSACRDRKLCGFYKLIDLDEVTVDEFCHKYASSLGRENEKLTLLSPLNSQGSPENSRSESIERPTEILAPLDNPKKEAQYFFTADNTEFFLRSFEKLHFKKIICLGAPRIHENLAKTGIQSILLDLDSRYEKYFPKGCFFHYNMFNNHFFDRNSLELFQKFLKTEINDCSLPPICLFLDPPFGGRVEVLAYTISLLTNHWKRVNKTDLDLPVMLIFPYFMETHLIEHLPHLTMLDYKVNYTNHPLFHHDNKGRKAGSPVRIFTNIQPRLIELPINAGYKWCDPCERWVGGENAHCNDCGVCPSKNGQTYIHCSACQRCVKPSWSHCQTCKRCCQQNHDCATLSQILHSKCHICQREGHKRRDCPNKNLSLKQLKKGKSFKKVHQSRQSRKLILVLKREKLTTHRIKKIKKHI